MELESRLIQMCIEAACDNRESVEKWRRQRRSLERLPSPLADALIRRLVHRRILFPSLLEIFKESAEIVDLRGENVVDAEWIAYLGAFRYLSSLNLSDCRRINSSALWPLSGMDCLKELDISRCSKVTDAGIRHLLLISSLEILRIAETGVTSDGVALLSSLKNLTLLDLGGLLVTDTALSSLQVLKKIEYLDLWGSKITNKGVANLQHFPKLSFLNLAWTSVTRLPNIPSLERLNLSDCTIESVLEGDGSKAPLTQLILSGATFVNAAEAFFHIEKRFLSFLDVSNSSLHGFEFLPCMEGLEHLDLSSSMMGDDSIELIASIGANLRKLNMNNTRVTSIGVALLAPHVPKLESLSLSHAPIDDSAIAHISMMPSLKAIDLSNTNIKGFIQQETYLIPSLTDLQKLPGLQSLNLEHTLVRDTALDPISSFKELTHLFLRSFSHTDPVSSFKELTHLSHGSSSSLTDTTLHHLSSLSKLKNLVIRDAVVTTQGLDSFKPPVSLETLDLRGCWLLTEEAISSFCKKYEKIEVKHELHNPSLLVRSGSNYSSPSHIHLKPSKVNQKKQQKIPSPSLIDQRLKYSREELLEWQCDSASL